MISRNRRRSTYSGPKTYDLEITLVGLDYDDDDIGNQVSQPPKLTTILCCEESVERYEFYTAATHGLKPDHVFTVHRFEYDGQQEVIFEGKRYTVIRTYSLPGTEEIELTVQRKVSNGKKKD